jgi:hypothetical protein
VTTWLIPENKKNNMVEGAVWEGFSQNGFTSEAKAGEFT